MIPKIKLTSSLYIISITSGNLLLLQVSIFTLNSNNGRETVREWERNSKRMRKKSDQERDRGRDWDIERKRARERER